ncbi:MAG: phosphopentomutase/phosphoglucosamine mutase [Halanaeroarchaeum sp.]
MELFGTAGIRGDARTAVTPELALAVGRAAGRNADEFVVGRDGRETGEALVSAVSAGLQSSGARVIEVGMVPTPALAYASRGRHGIMVTASHNPPEDNGIKLFDDGVEYGDDAEAELTDRVERGGEPVEWSAWGKRERDSVLEDYRHAVIEFVRTRDLSRGDDGSDREGAPSEPLTDLSVAVDCGNGMASLATPQVLSTLGASVVTINAAVDGHFPGRPSKPTPETIRDLRSFVADGSVDLGIAHDGDADRIVIVAHDGTVVHEDTIVAILAEYYVRTASVDDPVVVTTPNASGRIDERVRAVGGRTERVRLGALHEGINRAVDTGGDVVFAAEPWKHVHTDFGRWIDGVTSAAVLSGLVAAAGGLETLRDPVTERPYRKESVECPDGGKREAMATVEETLPATFPAGEVDTSHGVRIGFEDGSWVLVRPSGTEPYIRIYAESDRVDDLVSEVRATVRDAIQSHA